MSDKRAGSQRIGAVLAPVVTPFEADLAPDRKRFIRHCQWLFSQNCGLAPSGTTSDANSMSKGERTSLLDAFEESGRSDRTGFDVFVGSETFLLANMRNGGAGTISATANVNPAAIYELYAACVGQSKFENRESKLEQHQARLNVVREVFSSRKFSSMIAALKQAIAIYANDPEWARLRPPLVELTTEHAKLLGAEL